MNHQAYRLLIFIFLLYFTACSENTDRPNIIIINIDDLGWKDVGYMGTGFYNTPHIDQLAELGTIYTKGYAAASNCAPSRASLMTGLWTPRHGIYTVNSSARGKSRHRRLIPIENKTILNKDFNTLPSILQDLGYATCHAGKWHLGEDPLSYGFEVNIGGGHNGHPRSYYPPYGNITLEPDSNKYLTDLIMSRVIPSNKSLTSTAIGSDEGNEICSRGIELVTIPFVAERVALFTFTGKNVDVNKSR